jgi:hypothetical protein
MKLYIAKKNVLLNILAITGIRKVLDDDLGFEKFVDIYKIG